MYSSQNSKMFSRGGVVSGLLGSRMQNNKPPLFVDMSAPDYVGIPPLPKFAQGGIVSNIEKNLKKNKFQR